MVMWTKILLMVPVVLALAGLPACESYKTGMRKGENAKNNADAVINDDGETMWSQSSEGDDRFLEDIKDWDGRSLRGNSYWEFRSK